MSLENQVREIIYLAWLCGHSMQAALTCMYMYMHAHVCAYAHNATCITFFVISHIKICRTEHLIHD